MYNPENFSPPRSDRGDRCPGASRLYDVKEQKGNHESEETGGFSKSETQDGVLEELTTEGWVAGNTLDQSTKHSSDTNTGTSKTDGRHALSSQQSFTISALKIVLTGSLNLSGSDHGGGSALCNNTALLNGVASDHAGEVRTHLDAGRCCGSQCVYGVRCELSGRLAYPT